MTNLQDKLNNIISEFNFIKNNLGKEQSMEDFCAAFKLALISKLEQAGAIYDPTLEHIWCHAGSNTTENKKFFAFKNLPESEENEILSNLKNIHSVLTEYMAEFGSLENLAFNITRIEDLSDRDSFSDLIRGILVVKEVENVQR